MRGNIWLVYKLTVRFCQVLKGAVGTTLCQNEAEVKFQLEIDHQISPTEKVGAMRLIVSLIFPACSVSEIWESMSM